MTTDGKKQRGGQTLYTQALADQICERIANGETLRAICRDIGISWTTAYAWRAERPEFAERIARAREHGFDAIAEDTIEMIDEKPARTATQFGERVDPGDVAWQKNRVEQRLKLLAKWDPKRYGEKVAIGGADDLPPIKTMSDDALEARIAALHAKVTNG